MMHNIAHLKAYWVMIGEQTAQQSLAYGVDDLDGTVQDTTKIYSMAGSMEHPVMSQTQLETLIQQSDRIPIERNSIYEPLQVQSI
jgi:aminodeoxyfutalosine synthase